MLYALGLIVLPLRARAYKLSNDVLGEDPIPQPFPVHLGPALLIFFIHLDQTCMPVMLEDMLKSLGVHHHCDKEHCLLCRTIIVTDLVVTSRCFVKRLSCLNDLHGLIVHLVKNTAFEYMNSKRRSCMAMRRC